MSSLAGFPFLAGQRRPLDCQKPRELDLSDSVRGVFEFAGFLHSRVSDSRVSDFVGFVETGFL